MGLKIVGFTDKGEVRLADASGKIVAYGELELDNYVMPDPGETYSLNVNVTWVCEPVFDWDS